MAEDQGSGANLNVTDEAFQQLRTALEEARTIISQEKNASEDSMSTVAAGWRSDSQREYNRGQGELNVDMDRLGQAVENLCNLVQMSKDGFDTEEQNRIQEFKAVQARHDSTGYGNIASLA
ncbi:hypothetical protein ACFC1B_19385 [Streptomyces xiamenensis]|uniref:hypothetical protein n=1 Tax=Streptomyces xiamenensis TaxID=408015 RepID=UPI0035D71A94